MHDEANGIDRRGFLRAGLGVTAGAVAAGAARAQGAAPESKTIKRPGSIPERVFGKTGHTLPILGHGGSAMVESWSTAYMVPLESREKRAEMVRLGYDSGIRYFDTARVYSESEGIMAEGLKGVRDNVYLASKCAVSSPDQVRKSVETSLEQLQTDYVDCMQIHSPAIERVGAEGGMKIHAELAKLRDEGMIRFIGLTTHVAFEEVYKMIDTQAFDQVLLALGYVRKGMDTLLSNENLEWRERCVARAHELDMAIVGMKVMGLNLLGRSSDKIVPKYDEAARAKVPGAAVRWMMRDERIAMLNIGMSVPADIHDNVAILTGDTQFTNEDQALLADFAAQVYTSDYVKALRTV